MSPRGWAAVGFAVGTLGALAWWVVLYKTAMRPGLVAEVPVLVRQKVVESTDANYRQAVVALGIDAVVEGITRKALEDNLP